jgi:hypothetical protein
MREIRLSGLMRGRGIPLLPTLPAIAPWSAGNGLAATDSRLRSVDISHLSVDNGRMSMDNRRMSVDIALMSAVSHPLSAANRPWDVVPIHFHKEDHLGSHFSLAESEFHQEIPTGSIVHQ